MEAEKLMLVPGCEMLDPRFWVWNGSRQGRYWRTGPTPDGQSRRKGPGAKEEGKMKNEETFNNQHSTRNAQGRPAKNVRASACSAKAMRLYEALLDQKGRTAWGLGSRPPRAIRVNVSTMNYGDIQRYSMISNDFAEK